MSVRSRRSDGAGRSAMRSPGRPPAGRRQHRQLFWAAIARGLSSEDAAAEARVSAAVGVRWFRDGGGMPSLSRAPLSGRYLSFPSGKRLRSRAPAAVACAESRVSSVVRPRRSRESSVANAATRSGSFEYRAGTAQWQADRRGRHPKAAKLASNTKLRRYVQDRLAGAVERPDGVAVDGPRGGVDRLASRPAQGPVLGEIVEPGAYRRSAPPRLPR